MNFETTKADEKTGSRVHEALKAPWKIKNEIRRIMSIPYTRLFFALHGVPWGRNWKLYGTPVIQRYAGSTIRFGAGLQWRSWYSSNPLGITRSFITTNAADAEIVIGEDAKISGLKIFAQNSIRLGDRVRIGANSVIVDTDFHPLGAQARKDRPVDGKVKPVVIGDDVFIGANVLILKGTCIGEGSVIGAGSVVSGVHPPNSIIAGNPAKVIKEIV